MIKTFTASSFTEHLLLIKSIANAVFRFPNQFISGLTSTITSYIIPNSAASYTWLRNGVIVTGLGTGILNTDVDGPGNYPLRVNDVNRCTNVSNIITIKDSASGRCLSILILTVVYSRLDITVLSGVLSVYDSKGDRVFTKYYTIGKPYDRMDVDMRAYGKGLYWVEIGDRNSNRITMCSVVIQ